MRKFREKIFRKSSVKMQKFREKKRKLSKKHENFAKNTEYLKQMQKIKHLLK